MLITLHGQRTTVANVVGPIKDRRDKEKVNDMKVDCKPRII